MAGALSAQPVSPLTQLVTKPWAAADEGAPARGIAEHLACRGVRSKLVFFDTVERKRELCATYLGETVDEGVRLEIPDRDLTQKVAQ